MRKSEYHLTHIDGLRAVALMGVLLFHFEVQPFRGGFAGVDVFLTISGYLITRNIFAHHSKSSPFSLSDFYARRFFRLYPAATVTVLLSVLAAVAIFPDDLTKEVSQSGLAAMLVSANTFFHSKSGYFDSSTTVKPLLHMWSLSLEEQFYLMWAPLILVHFSFCSPQFVIARIKVTLIILSALSLFGGAYLAGHASSFAFFHLPSRIFQFAIGASLAAYQKGKDIDSGDEFANETLSSFPVSLSSTHSAIATTLAILIICVSYVLLPQNASPLALLPVNIATALLLACPDAPICRIVFSSTPFMFLGRLSYSAYLVHWPLYVFSRFVQMALGAAKPQPGLMLLASLFLALALKHSVEDPVRKRRRYSRTSFAIVVSVTLCVCMLVFNLEAPSTSIFRNQTESNAAKFLYGDDVTFDLKSNIVETEKAIVMHGKRIASRVARTGDLESSGEPAITFFGNSFTGHLAPALHLIGKRRKVWFRLYAAPSCGIYAPSQWSKIKPSVWNCRKVNEEMWAGIDQLPPNSTVALAQLWGILSLKGFVSRVGPIADELSKRNINAIFLGEPPGMDDKYESYYDCLDLLEKPFGRILHHQRNKAYCGLDFRGTVASLPARKDSETVYRKAFPREIPKMKFLNVMKEICSMTHNGKNETVTANCRIPTYSLLNQFPNMTDHGYKRDLRHLSLLGSAGLSYVYEKLINEFI